MFARGTRGGGGGVRDGRRGGGRGGDGAFEDANGAGFGVGGRRGGRIGQEEVPVVISDVSDKDGGGGSGIGSGNFDLMIHSHTILAMIRLGNDLVANQVNNMRESIELLCGEEVLRISTFDEAEVVVYLNNEWDWKGKAEVPFSSPFGPMLHKVMVTNGIMCDFYFDA